MKSLLAKKMIWFEKYMNKMMM